ncbi:MFS transporter [Nonomuraea guangzhouensis]|uniref:MFS transporter n=1 Tax=Nonomuraea guangzhouensis TaxID=1291555 RepID=A0ABW4G5N8_9ACTN|nr:MFS transporter [Nonomuraea guangzhouensis]
MSAPIPPRRQPAKAVLASWIGTTVEYYDFALYGFAASVLFAKIFFPATNPVVGTLISLSSFGVGFVARPVGALIFGHLGDRVGRKTILVITLTLMGAATTAIGLLPSYAQIGLAAPVLLVTLRIIQGISLGGEYSGAVLMTVEHAEPHRRGLFGSIINTGTTAGMVLANSVFLLVSQLPETQLMSWGWRVPFLLSSVLVIVGLVIRMTLGESPEFATAKDQGSVRKLPIVDVLRRCGGRVVLVALGTIAAGVVSSMTSVFALTYGKVALGMSTAATLGVLLPAWVVALVGVPLFGRIADRIGVRPLFLYGAASLIVLPFVWFALLGTRQYGLMLLGFGLLFFGYSANYAVFPVYFSQVFPTPLRFSGMSIGFTVGTIGGVAFAPAIAASILEASGGWIGIAAYMAGTAVVTLAAGLLLRAPETDPDEATVTRPGLDPEAAAT